MCFKMKMDNNTKSYFYYFYCSLFKYIFGQVTLSFKRWVVSTWVARIQKNKNNSNTAEEYSQWTHLRRLDIDSTSRFHVENSCKLDRFWKANPRGNYDIDSRWMFRCGFDFQNRRNIDEFSTWIFYVVSTSNRPNFCTRCFHFIIF